METQSIIIKEAVEKADLDNRKMNSLIDEIRKLNALIKSEAKRHLAVKKSLYVEFLEDIKKQKNKYRKFRGIA